VVSAPEEEAFPSQSWLFGLKSIWTYLATYSRSGSYDGSVVTRNSKRLKPLVRCAEGLSWIAGRTPSIEVTVVVTTPVLSPPGVRV
jgi:hypothetical protein